MEATQDLQFFEVGGCVRDDMLGLPVKDVDFAVEAPSFSFMVDALEAQGFKVFQVREEFLTVRAGVPKGSPLRERTKDADFVMCRADGPSADGRRPDFVTPGTLLDDLARRDFTVNAMARTVEGDLVDPFGGEQDLRDGVLRFVGDAMERVNEDGLRVMRGFRFMRTKGLVAETETARVLRSREAADMLGCVSVERVREELVKMFGRRFDPVEALRFFGDLPRFTVDAMLRDGLSMSAEFRQEN
jgi:tRNA nucleotidyltransferase (CCA-adding enzyme)